MKTDHGHLLRKPALTLAVLAISALLALFWIFGVLNPQPASADYALFYLDCPTTQVREGESFDVYLVRVTNHQHSGSFGAYWHTDAGTADATDYVHQDTDAIWANDSQIRASRLPHTYETKSDTIAEGDETFTVRISPTDRLVDPNDPDRDGQCEITIIDDDPGITGLGITSEPARSDTYGAGETIEIEATFSTEVVVDGNPALGIWVGDAWQSASYLRGSGSDTLVFGYTVLPGDFDVDGIKMDGGYKDSDGNWHNFLNHDAVTASGTDHAAYRAYEGFDDQQGHKVHGNVLPIGTNMEITSTPESGPTYRYGESIDIALTLTAPVEVTGSKHLNLRVGDGDDNWRGAAYKSGSGTDTLTFSYVVQPHDLDEDGITVESSYVDDGTRHGWGGSGTITVPGTDTIVPPNFTGLDNQEGHEADGRPEALSFEFTSTPKSGSESATYGRGEVIQVTVQFGQNVTADEWAVTFINMDSTRGEARYASGNGTQALIFEYTVQDGDFSTGGVSATLPQGQNIKATGTEILYNAWNQNNGEDLSSSLSYPSHKVDSSLVAHDVTPPSIDNVTVMYNPGPGDDDTYTTGDWIGIEVDFNEGVVVTGTPQIQITIGSDYRQANYNLFPEDDDAPGPSDNPAVIRFGYFVQEGDHASQGVSINNNAVTLNGGTIKDTAGNDALLNHEYFIAGTDHKVDAPDLTPPTVSSVAISSEPGDDDTYAIDDLVTVEVTFSEDVEVTGAPQLELDFADTPKTASYLLHEGAVMTFSYKVVLNDSAPDGIAIGADKLSLNGGTIKDGAEHDAELSHDAVDASSAHKVDGSDEVAPTVVSVAITSDPGDDDTYQLGDEVLITVIFSEPIDGTGSPQMTIDIGGTSRTAYHSSSEQEVLVLEYTISLDEVDTDGISIDANSLAIVDGEIQDAAGNDADLSHDALAADSGHKVDGTDSIAPTITSVAFTSTPGRSLTYRTGNTILITVTFDEDVNVTGTPQLELDMYESEPSERQASYTSSYGSHNEVVFSYVVQVGDFASDGLAIGANKLTLNGGTIQDASGNDADLSHDAVPADSGHQVSGAGGV